MMPRIRIPEGAAFARIEFETGSPRPVPVPFTSPFPEGWGCWKYPGDEYADELVTMGARWVMNWSYSYVGYLRPDSTKTLPYVFEMQPEYWHKKEQRWKVKRGFDRLDDVNDKLDRMKRLLDYHGSAPNCVGVNLSNETGQGPHTAVVWKYLREHYPQWKIFTGPFMYEMQDPDTWDGIMGGHNFTRYDRLPGDIYWCEAIANMHGLPWCISVQPVNGGGTGPIHLANPEWFAAAVTLAEQVADGLNFWAIGRLLTLQDTGVGCLNIERLPGILEVLKEAWLRPLPFDRPKCKVLFTDNHAENKMLARVAGAAGQEVVGTFRHSEADLRPSDLEFSNAELLTWARFKQCKFGDARLAQVETEHRMAMELEARMGG